MGLVGPHEYNITWGTRLCLPQRQLNVCGASIIFMLQLFVMASILAPMCPKHPPCPGMHYSRLWELGRGAIERK